MTGVHSKVATIMKETDLGTRCGRRTMYVSCRFIASGSISIMRYNNNNPGRHPPRSQTPSGVRIGTVFRYQDSQTLTQETSLSSDFTPMSDPQVLSFLDSTAPSPNGFREVSEGPPEDSAQSTTLSQHISLSFKNLDKGRVG